MSNAKIWLTAFRLKTLPLALSCAITGSFLAAANGQFSTVVAVLAIATTIFLQILSNLANDYGDAVSGADNEKRIGPQRVTHTGLVTRNQIKKMIILFASLSFGSGVVLVLIGLKGLSLPYIIGFIGLGLAAIAAAIRYTVGKNPYGYRGRGDIFVFLFFGLIGVSGTFFLHTHQLDYTTLLPAASIGLFSAGVLNINNLRDIHSDTNSGKETLVVKYGVGFGKKYHSFLILTGIILSITYNVIHYSSVYNFLWILIVPLFLRSIIKINKHKNSDDLIPELKNLALYTFGFSLLFGIAILL